MRRLGATDRSYSVNGYDDERPWRYRKGELGGRQAGIDAITGRTGCYERGIRAGVQNRD